MTACDAVRELLAAHALDALAPTEATLVRDHLRDCAACREAETQARADVDVIDAPDVAPPPEAWARIRQRIAAGQAGDEPVRANDAPEPGALIAVSCSFCRGTLARVDSVYCASCLAPHHPDCWREYGRCSVMGCGEQRVVRPTERADVAPAPVAMPGKDGKLVPFDEVRRRRRSRRLLGGGLFVAITGGLAAAGLQPVEDPPSLQLPDPVEAAFVPPSRPQLPPDEPRWDVVARDASLAELCAALEREAGAKIDLSAGLTDALVRDGRWRARTWREVLSDLNTQLGLGMNMDVGDGRVAFFGTARERATATLEQRTTQLLELAPRWRLTDLRSGPPHQVAVAPAARALALVEGRTVRVLARGHDASFTFQTPVRHAVWRDDGARLAIACDDKVVVLEVDASRPPTFVDRQPVDAADPVQHVAWGPGAAKPTVTTWLASTWPTKVVPNELAELSNRNKFARFVEPLSDTMVLEVTRFPGFEAAAFMWGTTGKTDADSRWSFQTRFTAAVDLDLSRSRLLVVDKVIRLHDTATGEPLGEAIPRRATSTWLGDLAPDGARVAWIDGGLLFVRRLAADGSTEGVDAQVIAQGSGEAIAGCAWRGDGHALALWTARGELAVVETRELDVGGTIAAPVQLEQADLQDARWAGDALVLTSNRTVPRKAQVQVVPSGELPRQTELQLDVEWTTEGTTGTDVFGVPSAPDAPPTVTEQVPVAEPPPAEAPPPPPLEEVPAPIPDALAHVRVGQRYTFTGTSGDVRTWEVHEVSAQGAVYSQSVALRGTTLGEPTRDTWTPRHPERIVQAAKERRERLTVGDVTFDCLVREVGDTVTWTAVDGSWTAFPGVVRYERGGKLMWALTGIE
jgi:hypothetical protein